MKISDLRNWDLDFELYIEDVTNLGNRDEEDQGEYAMPTAHARLAKIDGKLVIVVTPNTIRLHEATFLEKKEEEDLGTTRKLIL